MEWLPACRHSLEWLLALAKSLVLVPTEVPARNDAAAVSQSMAVPLAVPSDMGMAQLVPVGSQLLSLEVVATADAAACPQV